MEITELKSIAQKHGWDIHGYYGSQESSYTNISFETIEPNRISYNTHRPLFEGSIEDILKYMEQLKFQIYDIFFNPILCKITAQHIVDVHQITQSLSQVIK